MRDMTQGAPLGHLFFYAVPLLLGNWLQLAYNAVDAIIVGRFLGQGALAAEGVAGPVMNLVILAISGLCIGAGVLMSEACGARDAETLRAVLATTLLAGAALCVTVALLGAVCAPWVLRALAVPGEIYAPALAYLRITFLGAPFTFFYNALAAALKSIGDSKTPLKFLAFSAVLNAALDLVFIGVLVSGREFGGSDTFATSQILAAAVNKVGVGPEDIVFCGRQAIDGDTAQVGPQIAEKLHLPQVTYVTDIQKNGNDLIVKRQLEDGYMEIKVHTPCLLTCIKELNEPRYMSVPGIFECYDKPIDVFDYNALKDDPLIETDTIGLKGSPTNVYKSFAPPVKGAGMMVEDAAQLVGILNDKHLI